MAMAGGMVMMRMQNPTMMHSEHNSSMTIIVTSDAVGLIPNTPGNVATVSVK